MKLIDIKMERSFLRGILFLLMAAVSVFSVSSRDLISHTILQNNLNLGPSDIIEAPDPICVSLNRDVADGEKTTWKVYILRDNDEYENVAQIRHDSVRFWIDPSKFSWRNSKKFFKEELNRDLYRIKIEASAQEEQDSLILNWGLLPTRPIIKDVEFTYEYDWTDDWIYPNGLFSCMVEASYVDRYWIWLSESFLFEAPVPVNYTSFYEFMPSLDKRFEYDADWGEFLRICAYNSYGFVYAEPICTSWYIEDEDILKRLDEIKETGMNKVDNVSDESLIKLEGRDILFADCMDNVSIYNLTGALINSFKDLESVNLSELKSGVYLIVYQKDAQIFNKKIMIK